VDIAIRLGLAVEKARSFFSCQKLALIGGQLLYHIELAASVVGRPGAAHCGHEGSHALIFYMSTFLTVEQSYSHFHLYLVYADVNLAMSSI
jgi:hypothetical protein